MCLQSVDFFFFFFFLFFFLPHCWICTQPQAQDLLAVVMYLTLIIQLFCTTSINMAALLTKHTKEEQCAVIRFLWAEGVKRCRNSLCTISTVWWQCSATVKCVCVEWHIWKCPNRCHWQRRTRVLIHINWSQHSTNQNADSH
jgi:hypothetical protein